MKKSDLCNGEFILKTEEDSLTEKNALTWEKDRYIDRLIDK